MSSKARVLRQQAACKKQTRPAWRGGLRRCGLFGMLVRLGRMAVCLLAVFVRGRRMLARFLVTALLMLMGGAAMMVGGSLMVGCCVVVVLG